MGRLLVPGLGVACLILCGPLQVPVWLVVVVLLFLRQHTIQRRFAGVLTDIWRAV